MSKINKTATTGRPDELKGTIALDHNNHGYDFEKFFAKKLNSQNISVISFTIEIGSIERIEKDVIDVNIIYNENSRIQEKMIKISLNEFIEQFNHIVVEVKC